jgi:hypothetical protein
LQERNRQVNASLGSQVPFRGTGAYQAPDFVPQRPDSRLRWRVNLARADSNFAIGGRHHGFGVLRSRTPRCTSPRSAQAGGTVAEGMRWPMLAGRHPVHLQRGTRGGVTSPTALHFAASPVASFTGYPGRPRLVREPAPPRPRAQAPQHAAWRAFGMLAASSPAEERVHRRLGSEFNHRGKETS